MELLYPIDNEFRHSIPLDGSWYFAFDENQIGWEAGIPKRTVVNVPADIQDSFIKPTERSFSGTMWYERTMFIPKEWLGETVYLHFEGVGRRAEIYVNGSVAGRHEGVFIPFAIDITRQIRYGEENKIVIQISNGITPYDLPTGHVRVGADGRKVNVNHSDYPVPTGLYASVHLCTVPQNRITDVDYHIEKVTPEEAVIHYMVKIKGNCLVTAILRDREGRVVATSVGGNGRLLIHTPHLWYIGDGYLYRLDFDVSRLGKHHDTYSLPIGIRTIKIDNQTWCINGKQVILRGVRVDGRHVDAMTASPIMARRELIRLLELGGNCIFSGGYTLPEYIITLADQMGLLVIDEISAAGMGIKNVADFDDIGSYYSQADVKIRVMQSHLNIVKAIMNRDKNHSSVIGWSLFYEPGILVDDDERYFNEVYAYAKTLDRQYRPLGMTVNLPVNDICKSCIAYNNFLIISQWVHEEFAGPEALADDLSQGLHEWQEQYPTMPLIVRLAEYNHRDVKNYFSVAERIDINEQYLLQAYEVLEQRHNVVGELMDSLQITHPAIIRRRWKHTI